MNEQMASAVSDIALAGGTFLLALTFSSARAAHTWKATFFALALSAALGALFHGTSRFHSNEFWVLVSSASCASAFLFFAACGCLARPNWKWLQWLWPFWGVAGILVGGILAPFPFFYISILGAVAMVASAYLLKKSPNILARRYIWFGMAVTLVGFVVQRFTHMEGLLSHNSLFHFFQLAGNGLFWLGARRGK